METMVRRPSFVTSNSVFGNELVQKCSPDAERHTGFTRRAAEPLSKWQRSIGFGHQPIRAQQIGQDGSRPLLYFARAQCWPPSIGGRLVPVLMPLMFPRVATSKSTLVVAVST